MMIKAIWFLASFVLLCGMCSMAQDEDDGMIRTTDGHAIAAKSSFVAECKKAYGAAAGDSLVNKVCECEANLLNNHFTTHQLAFFQRRYKEKALRVLLEQDAVLQKRLKECRAPAEHLLLVSIPSSRKFAVRQCVDNLKKKNTKPLNDTLAERFCNCAIGIMQKRKITVERTGELADPTSFLYNEIAYQCGSPYVKPSEYTVEWKAADSADISGSVSVDSVQVISVLGMHKVKITIGGITKIWLLDSGASDLLISDEYAKELAGKGILSNANYLGEGEYLLADNSVITCRRYKINGVKIGNFALNNVILSTSKNAKEFLLGKSVLNKFSQWSLDNKNDRLILKK